MNKVLISCLALSEVAGSSNMNPQQSIDRQEQMLNSIESTSINGDTQISNFLNDPDCNKECLGLCLSYFPTELGVQKCGCSSSTTLKQDKPFELYISDEKFFQESKINQSIV